MTERFATPPASRRNARRQVILAGLLAFFLPACGKQRKASPVPPGSTVLAFGDSVTFGTGAGAGEDWPSLLGQLAGWRVINAGIPGDTAEAGKARIQALLDEHRPALVIIEIGGNDFLRRRPAAAVKEDIRHLAKASRAAGAQVVLLAVPELSLLAAVAGRPGDSPIYREIGREDNVPVVADVFSNILAQPELCADKIHPNAAGYREFAKGVFAGLRELGLRG